MAFFYLPIVEELYNLKAIVKMIACSITHHTPIHTIIVGAACVQMVM